MSRSSPQTGASYLARTRGGSDRSTQTRRRNAGPATKGSPPADPAPKGYTSEKSGTVLVVKRIDIGAIKTKVSSAAHHEPGVLVPGKFPNSSQSPSEIKDNGVATNTGHFRKGRGGRCFGKRASG